jgi:cyclase
MTDVRATLRAGADIDVIDTAALGDPDLIDRCASEFGRQCVVLAMDARWRGDSWEVYSHGGRTATGRDAVGWAAEGTNRGAGELLVTSMDRDGTYNGYDLDLLRAIKAVVSVPVIASGGAGSIDDCVDAFDGAGVDAVLAASIFHRDEISLASLKAGLAAAGVAVRV